MSGLTRRQFVQGAGLAGLGLLAGCGWPLPVPALGAKVHRVGYLRSTPSDAANGPNVLAFQQGMRDLGYVEGENLLIEQRYADSVEQLREPVAELVRLQPEVILVAGVASARGVLAVTTTIPIVSAGTGALDLVASGLALSHARPGGTVTGLSSPSLEGKQLQLLQEAVPTLSRVAIVFDATVPGFQPSEQVEAAARTLGLRLQFVGADGTEALDRAFDTAVREHVDGVLVLQGPVTSGSQQPRIAELAMQHRLPSMWSQTEVVESGGFIAYGPNRASMHRRAAYYVDRILQGTRPADLPVEQPMLFDFVINLKTAQALGLTIPQHMLLQATEVIQ